MISILRCCKINPIPSLKKVISRQYMKTSEKMEMLLKKSDHVSFKHELVYRQQTYIMTSFMYHTVIFTGTTSIVTLLYMLYSGAYVFDTQPNNPDIIMRGISNYFELFGAFAAMLGVMTLSSVMRRRYPLRIYFNEKDSKFRAIFIGKAPFTSEFYEFPKHSLTFVAKGSILPWRSVLFNANGRKIMLYDDNFRTQSDFYMMLKHGEFDGVNPL